MLCLRSPALPVVALLERFGMLVNKQLICLII
ncbi:hypothetical protein [Pantoea sp. LMR881]